MSVFHPMILNDPAIWALPAGEFKLYAALLVFVRPDGTGAFPSNETLAEMVGVNERSIKRLLSDLEAKGIIDRTHSENPDGSFRRTITVNYVPVLRSGHATVSKSWKPDPKGGVIIDPPGVTSNTEGVSSVTRGGVSSVTPEHTHIEHTQKNNDDDEERKTPSAESGEPFEMPPSANPARMPVVASLPIRPPLPREHVPVQVPPEMRDRIYTTLGTYGDDFVRRLTQEMVDKPGFIDDTLRAAARGKRPVALALKLLADFGNWISPMERHEMDKAVRNEIFFRKLGVRK